jgi:hypothetical protein
LRRGAVQFLGLNPVDHARLQVFGAFLKIATVGIERATMGGRYGLKAPT